MFLTFKRPWFRTKRPDSGFQTAVDPEDSGHLPSPKARDLFGGKSFRKGGHRPRPLEGWMPSKEGSGQGTGQRGPCGRWTSWWISSGNRWRAGRGAERGFHGNVFRCNSQNASVKHPFLSLPNRQKAVQFWSRRVSKFRQIHNKGGKGKGVNKHHNLRRDNQGPSPYALMPHASENTLPCHTTLSPMEMLEIGSKPKKDAECFTSQVSPVQSKAHGLASLDTGASRSVIGIEHVPAVMQKLPMSVRQSIKECPSKVGFRFGNNQIAYSFNQFQIPLKQGKKRIWLLIEVVPKATPFLLSVKAMKSLGATIDLANSTCYLKTLDRSLPLKESSSGLFVIDMADLCQVESSSNAAAFCASSSQIDPPPGLSCEHHADPSGSAGRPEGDRQRDHAESQDSDDALHNDQGCQPRRGSVRDRDESSQSAHSGKCAVTKWRSCNELGSILSQQFLKNNQSQPIRHGRRAARPHRIRPEAMKPSCTGPGISQPMASSPQVMSPEVPRHSVVHIPGIPVQHRPPAPVRQASSSDNQVALTSAALAHWGKKVVTWGKIHKGDSYETTYEQDEC